MELALVALGAAAGWFVATLVGQREARLAREKEAQRAARIEADLEMAKAQRERVRAAFARLGDRDLQDAVGEANRLGELAQRWGSFCAAAEFLSAQRSARPDKPLEQIADLVAALAGHAERLVRDSTPLLADLREGASRDLPSPKRFHEEEPRWTARLDELLVLAGGVRAEIVENRERFIETSNLASVARAEAERGYRAVHETLEEFEATRKLSAAAQERMNQLTARIASIDDVVHAITQIAQRTRLLALNASIIAAQSGEHAAGFVVLADEIKALAQRTAASSEEIVGQIRRVQGETARASEAMAASVSAIERGLKVAFQAGDALGSIRESNRQAQRKIQTITRSVEQSLNRAEGVVSVARSLAALGERQQAAQPLAADRGAGAARAAADTLAAALAEHASVLKSEAERVVRVAEGIVMAPESSRQAAGSGGPEDLTTQRGVAQEAGTLAAGLHARLLRVRDAASTVSRLVEPNRGS